MTADEVNNMICDKGYIAQTLYHSTFCVVLEAYFEHFENFDADVCAIISYNVTRIITQEILDNISYFSDKIYLSESSLERASKDLEEMHHLDYPDRYDDEYLDYIVEGFTMIPTETD